MTNESQKEFWKNRLFENTRASFLLRCQNSLRQNSPEMMHFQAWKEKEFNQYCVVAFDPNEIYTHWAPQNDCLNLSFVEDTYVVAKRMTINGRKMAIFETQNLISFLTKLKNTADGKICHSS